MVFAPRLPRPLSPAAVASALGLAMSACGPDESDETSGQPVNRPSASSDVAPAGQKVDTREFATLIADAFGKDDTADMSMQLISNGYVTEAEGQIDYSAKTPRMAMTMSVPARSEEHTSELQSLMRISSAVFCLKKKNKTQTKTKCQPQIRNKHE